MSNHNKTSFEKETIYSSEYSISSTDPNDSSSNKSQKLVQNSFTPTSSQNQINPSIIQNFTLETQLVQASSPLYNYQKVYQISSENYGDDYLYKRKIDNTPVCLNFFNLKNAGLSNYSDLESEINHLKELIHPNIIKYFDHFPHEDNIVIVVEYIEGISFKEKINEQHKKKESFSEKFIIQIFS
jgi:hypothetical protein